MATYAFKLKGLFSVTESISDFCGQQCAQRWTESTLGRVMLPLYVSLVQWNGSLVIDFPVIAGFSLGFFSLVPVSELLDLPKDW